MSGADPRQVRQWTDEVAADPASPAFLPLARHHRAAGRRDLAVQLVVRGLRRHPNDVEAHHLLGLLYREGGDALKAFDEWDIALALSPEHHGARRELGLLCLERGEWEAAVRHLERALETDLEDADARAALEAAWARLRGGAPAPAAEEAPVPPPPPPADGTRGSGWAGGEAWDEAQAGCGALARERGMLGAVLLDAQGYVLAGEMAVEGADRAAEVAAVLSGASAEAERTLRHLRLGGWKGILVETPEAVVRLAPAGDGMVAVAARRDVPTGWVLRVAGRAREAAGRFLAALEGGPA
ncbi:MAG TPA: roadblock/LC7 domain-containing protein [Longimicrobiaceae bacterium]|nr:roadblock/LC7 domain-containing protein [Longimicrobiaceae bacterium]